MTFTAPERVQLISILPQEVGSLREATQIKRLRDTIQLTEEERDKIALDPQSGSFDPQALQELDPVDVDMTETKRRAIAYAFIQKEDEDSVPTSDAFISLAEKFAGVINDVKKELEADD